MPAPEAQAPAHSQATPRRFGRFSLLELLGRSELTMAWRAFDPRLQRDFVVVMPRAKAASSAQLLDWETSQRRVLRLQHPLLVPIVESGHHEGWPFVLYDHGGNRTLAARLDQSAVQPRQAATIIRELCEALAFAHQSGVVHADPQTFLTLSSESGNVRLMGLEVAFGGHASAPSGGYSQQAAALAESDRLRRQRDVAQRDLLGFGLLMYRLLCGQLPLDEPDTGKVIARIPPLGREIVRLPWSTPQPVPEGLRAICNRATDRQARQRYRSVRSFIQALDGWLRADESVDGSALVLLKDRLARSGVLPAAPGVAERAARIVLMDRKRINDLAELILQDIALTLDLIRMANLSRARSARMADSASILTVRRAISLLGLESVRKSALSLRAWPGPLDESGARELALSLRKVQLTVRLAQALRPPGWDAEVVGVATLLQHLGSLLVQYHFPDEALQIRKLMQPGPDGVHGEADEPGMSERSASFAVLGVDSETLGSAVAKHWGLGEGVTQLMRRASPEATVHVPESEDDVLTCLASCAHEACVAMAQPAQKAQAALALVVKRYGRALDLTLHRLQEACTVSQSASAAKAGPVLKQVVSG